jgi:hypothetical protein
MNSQETIRNNLKYLIIIMLQPSIVLSNPVALRDYTKQCLELNDCDFSDSSVYDFFSSKESFECLLDPFCSPQESAKDAAIR